MAEARRYTVVIPDGVRKMLLVGERSCEILQALKGGSEYSYRELSDKTGIPMTSLYVFCERLEKAKLIKRERGVGGEPRRLRTVLKRTTTVTFHKPIHLLR